MNKDLNNNGSLKILSFATKAEIGGAQKHICILEEILHERYDIKLYTGVGEPLLEQMNSCSAKHKFVPELNSKTFFPAILAVYKIIKSEKPDLIHTHSAIASFVGRIAGRLAGVKTLYTVHGWHFVPTTVWQRRIFGWLLELIARPFTTAWITVSEYDLELGVKKGVIDRKRAYVVPNGVDELEVVKQQPKAEGLKLVFVGRASFQKNCFEAIEIIKLSPSNVSLTMYVTSGDHLPALNKLIVDSDLEHRVTLITDNPEASNELHEYDAMLLTSRYEGMPLCILEAMQAGLPVVATDVCGMNEIVNNGVTGYLYDLYDVDEAAKCIKNLLNIEKRIEMGTMAQDSFRENFRAQIMAQRTAEIYDELLN